MRVETINEPIETIVHFTPQSINVLRFKWNNRAYKVQKTTQRYFRTEGTIKILHFAVIADNQDNFDLSFNLETFKWKIERVCLYG